MKTLKMTADEFNANYPVGTPVRYWPVLPPMKGIPPVETKTLTKAWTLGHGQPVVSVEGPSGGVAIEHLEPSSHLLAGTVWAMNEHGHVYNSDPESRDYALFNESTRDVIFLFQRRQTDGLDLVNGVSEGEYYHDGETMWFDSELFSDLEISKAIEEERFEEANTDHGFDAISVDDDEMVERGWVTWHWETVSVWLNRAEAEAYAKAKSYKFGEYGKNCRVFGDVSEGRLAKVLSVIQNQQVEEFLQSPEFAASYAAYRAAKPLGALNG